MLVFCLRRLVGWLIPERDRSKNPLARVSAKDGVVTQRWSVPEFISSSLYLPLNFQLQSWWRMPFGEGSKVSNLDPRSATTTKQFLFIWLFTFRFLRTCPAAIFMGIVLTPSSYFSEFVGDDLVIFLRGQLHVLLMHANMFCCVCLYLVRVQRQERHPRHVFCFASHRQVWRRQVLTRRAPLERNHT